MERSEYTAAVERADEAMQDALKALPLGTSQLKVEHATTVFRHVRSLLVAAVEDDREVSTPT